MRTSSKRRSCRPTPTMRTSPAFWRRSPASFAIVRPHGTGATQRFGSENGGSSFDPRHQRNAASRSENGGESVPCDDQALDFEEGDQPDGPADISTMRASARPGNLDRNRFYWKLADGEIVRCAENLVAMSTKVGWILSGSLPVDTKPLTPRVCCRPWRQRSSTSSWSSYLESSGLRNRPHTR